MKKFIFLFALIPSMLLAQNNWLEKNIKLNDADSNHVKATLSGKAFELMSYAKPDSILSESVIKLAKSVHGMVGYMDLSSETTLTLMGKMKSDKSFAEYAKIQRSKDQMALYINEKDGVIKEAIMLVSSKEENIAVSMYGDLDMRLFAEMYKLIPFEQMHQLQHRHEHAE